MEIDDTVVLGLFGVALIAYVSISIKRLEEELAKVGVIAKEIEIPEFNFDEVRDEVAEIVEDFLHSVKMPSLGDTLLQYGAQFAANKFGIGIPFANQSPQLDIPEPESEEVWQPADVE